MCGIVGYVGLRDATSILLHGLERLEYRGYDSAGIALIDHAQIRLRRAVGKLIYLRQCVESNPPVGSIGIGHTRWATHGAPSEYNAHPHLSMCGNFTVVHNGIVENHLELRETLIAQGVKFDSDTDSEVIVQSIARCAQNMSLVEAVRSTIRLLRGAHAIVVMSIDQPDTLIAVRVGNAGGLTIGIGEGEHYIASDLPAVVEHTRKLVFLEDGQIAVVTANGFAVETLEGEPIVLETHYISYDSSSAAKGDYVHFMQKEIFEQPRAISDTIAGRINVERGEIILPDLHLTAEHAREIARIVITACGTSYYSGLIGKFFIEQIARIPVEVDYASEYRYRNPILDKQTAVLAITQSGETVDTLAAMEEARVKGATVWSIVNAVGSQAMRISDGFITMNAGQEIGVASTKAYTTSVVDQYLLAICLAQLRGTMTEQQRRQHLHEISLLPDLVGQLLKLNGEIEALAEQLSYYRNFFYLGRGINYPTALEGALKLKEISYLHAEGYPAGEMKHGPIALIDEHMVVLAIALQDRLYDKMLSQVEQVKARGGMLVALVTKGETVIASKADHLLYLPHAPEYLTPILSVIPLQLLAYHIAVLRGAEVDQPRNLAKSVTVE